MGQWLVIFIRTGLVLGHQPVIKRQPLTAYWRQYDKADGEGLVIKLYGFQIRIKTASMILGQTSYLFHLHCVEHIISIIQSNSQFTLSNMTGKHNA